MIKYLFFLIGVIIPLEYYTYISIRTLTNSRSISFIYLIISMVLFLSLFIVGKNINDSLDEQRKAKITYISILIVVFYMPKIFLSIPLILEDLAKLFLYNNHKKLFSWKERKNIINLLSLTGASFAFFSAIHGIIWGRYFFNLMKKEIYFEDLPSKFDGLKIIHLSDIHSGSFYLKDREKIQKGIALIMKEKPDLILFTGDLVNNKASEMDPWISLFSQLKAPLGIYAILGNHDYGDYLKWPTNEDKENNFEALMGVYKKLNWSLLKNEHVKLTKDNEAIYLIGVENWGYDPFPKYGDLKKSTHLIDEKAFKILLSHDPSHFDGEIKAFSKKIHLTLSGHTHGMQFGIEIPGLIKWSPVKYRYPKWAGLYEEKKRYLYVNRGFGYLAFPGRIGIWPEITCLTLRKNP